MDRRAKDLLGLEAVASGEYYDRCHTGCRAIDMGGHRRLHGRLY